MAWGNSGGKGAREVAAAFYEGRKLRRGNACTDGRTYWLFDHPIARRVPPDDIPEIVAQALEGKDTQRLLEFSWAGWATPTTEAHLEALGLRAWKGSENQREPRKPELNCKPVEVSCWYTLEELAAMPVYVAVPKKPRAAPSINHTLPLFA